MGSDNGPPGTGGIRHSRLGVSVAMGVGLYMVLFSQYWLWKGGVNKGGSVQPLGAPGSTFVVESGEQRQDSSAASPQSLQPPVNLTPNHPRIYIAKIPTAFNRDLFPNRRHQKFLREPFGEFLAQRGILEVHGTTDSPSQEWITHSLLLRSPLRVDTPQEADLIYVPFYAGVALRFARGMRNQGDGGDEKLYQLFDKFWKDFDHMVPEAKSKPAFMVLAQPEVEFIYSCGTDWRKGHTIDFLCHKKAKRMTFLVYESFHGLPHPPSKTEPYPLHGNVVTMVPAGKVHLSPGRSFQEDEFDAAAILAKKQLLVTESFRSRFELRTALKKDCLARPKGCVHYEPESGTRFNLTLVHDQLESGWFCNQPHGDTATRTQTFDCLGAGAIPVFFDDNGPLMMPFVDVVDWKNAVVVLPRDYFEGKGGANMLDLLGRYTKKQRLAMLEHVYELRHLMQYSMEPAQELIRFDTMQKIDPEDDAFTQSMKAMLRNMCRRGLLPRERCPEAAKKLGSKSFLGFGRR